MKVHIPNSLYKKAKKRQQQYRERGMNKPLYEIIKELDSDFSGPAPSINDIKQAVEEAVRNNLPRNGGRGPGWLG